ncbi:MAG TPA: hypothetical protein H9870_12425 [Candidatus Corynebacterium avicola]|uniref:Uncharacterized protein n=1 Tax=Candidatus Corynebacterium avicola TaxID=2838527 RepID=A0A9D1RQS4_9CORY|nr:hypothetical protein [Candidatus Corynebacterium avicola]
MRGPGRQVSRRTFLVGAGAVGVGAAAVGGAVWLGGQDGSDDESPDSGSDLPALDPGPLQLQVNDADHPGRVTVLTADGLELVHFDGYRLTSSIGTRAATVDDPSAGEPGPGPVRVEFEVTDPDYTAAVTYSVDGSTVSADWEFGVPGTGYAGGEEGEEGSALLRSGRIYRTLVDAASTIEGSDVSDGADGASGIHIPATRWNRDPGGGVPVLERVTEMHFSDWIVSDGEGSAGGESRICGCLSAENSRSRNATGVHAPPNPPEEGADGADGLWRAHVEFRADTIVADARDLLDSGRTLLAGGVLGHPALPERTVDVTGPGTYNVLTEDGGHTFTVGVAGAGQTDVEVIARSFTGDEVHRSTHTVEVPEGTAYVDTEVTIDLPGPRSWTSVEVTCPDSFARTAAAVWPEYDYGEADGSIVGLSGFSAQASGSQSPSLESTEEEKELWRRIGVAHLRNPWLTAEESADLGISNALQPAGSPGQFTDERLDSGGQTFTEWATENIDRGEEADVSHYELLNEWNVDGTDKTARAKEYTSDWLIPFRQELDRRGSSAKLIAMALAGWDASFLDTIDDGGGWDALDGIAEHAGRGNYVPDYDAGRWNFLGQVRTARAYLDGRSERGGKAEELWLTECYACTRPNAWWYDDERTAADSVLLSLMLAKAEGATGTHWFQLTDGLWHDKHGADPVESEYHYGLLHVDRSPKPSLPAFAHAAEWLDGAAFLGWIESPHPDLRGLRFRKGGDGGADGADGAVFWVLWNRHDGYLHNADHGADSAFPHPEPWVVPDGHTLNVTVPGADAAVDVLGAEVSLEDDGRVKVGTSPVIVSGDLDPELAGPETVTGEKRIDLTEVTVRRADDSDSSLVIEGVNGTGSRLGLRIMGRQEGGAVDEKSIVVPSGDFSRTVDMGEAMPLDDDTPAASIAGSTDGMRPQVRVLAQKRERTVPEAAETQVYRAEFYRSV